MEDVLEKCEWSLQAKHSSTTFRDTEVAMKSVIFPLKLQMKRAEIGDLHQALSVLGFSITGPEKRNQRFGASTRAAVRQFQANHKLRQTGAVNAATAKAINQALADGGLLTPPPPGGESPGPVPPPNPPDDGPPSSDFHVVTGRVLRDDGPPIVGVDVQALHKNLRSEILLGTQRVDAEGRYTIRYTPPDGVHRADLTVRAINTQADAVLAASDVICHARRREVIDLIVGGTEYRGFSEFERISQAVQPHLEGVPLHALTVADVELLECKTRQNPIHIAYLAIANQYGWTEVPAEAFYGFFRMGLPTSLLALVAQQTRALQRALRDALDENIIPGSFSDDIASILLKLKQTSVKLALDVPEGQETISLGPLLSTAGLSAAQQGIVLARYSLHQGTIQEFWAGVKADPVLGKPEVVGELQFTLQLGALASGYVPLVGELQKRRKAGQFSSIQDLSVFQHQQWLALIRKTGTPPGIPGNTESEREVQYAHILKQTIERAFPTPSVVAGFKRLNLPDQQDLLRFFDNSPDFTFEANIDRYLLEKGDPAVDGVTDVLKLRQQLKQQQRVYNVAPELERFTAMTALLDAGLDSAQAIVNMGQPLFVKSLSGPLGGEALASEVFNKAVQTHARALTTFGQYSLALSIGTPAVIRNLTAQGAGIPTWESLFGSVSFCECKDCRSVYSPAAYFVDLLQFVKQQPAIQIVGGTVTYPTVTLPDGTTRPKTALDVLFERRSDLGEIQLSCQNTNTLMPYIDLVNEVLENAVVAQSPIYQTTWTAEELSANAEHQTEGAYLVLAVQVYPRLLPFNLWLHDIRTYLAHLGVSIVELIDVLYRPGQTGALLVALELLMAVESLSLSLASAQIITSTLPRPRSLWEFWGWHLEPPNWPDVLDDLPTFLARAEIEYGTLEELRKTRFINANEQLSVTFATPCNIEGATIKNLTEPLLDKIHRFLRLQLAISWKVSELDAAITALQTPDLTPAFLVQVSQIQRLKTTLNRPLLEMLSWWSTISTAVDESDAEDRSFYDDLFLNNAVISPVDDVFQLNGTRSDLENAGTAPLGEHKPTILAALSITEADLALILTGIGKTEAEGLTLALLSELYRYASLAKALDLSIADFLSLKKLTGIDPFKNPWTTLRTFEEAEWVAQSKFNIATLDYVLRHVYTETSGLTPTESSIVSVLDSIKTGLQTIAAENVFAADPTGDLTRGRLALLLIGTDLQDAIAIIEGTSTLSLTEQNTFIDDHFAIFLGDTTATKLLLNQSIDPTQAAQQKQARYEHILNPLVTYLKTTLSTQLVVQTIADVLTLETAVAESMLTEYVNAPHDTTKKAIAIFITLDPAVVEYTDSELDTYRLVHKIATVLSTLKVAAEELVWIFDKGPALGWLNLNQLPLAPISDTQVANLYAGWKRLVALYDFRDEYPAAGDVTVFSVFDQVSSGSDHETVLGTISSLTSWNIDDLTYLTGTGGFKLTFPGDYGDERYLVQLQEAFTLLARLGVSAATAYSWQAFENLEQLKATAAAIKSAAKAKYDNATWLTVAEPLKNQLREQQRNALMAHLIARRPGVEEASDLFEQYLIDAEINACMKTSRIKQAISSVQLFVQRSLMNLEPHVEISETSAQQWPWMKNYRVWEANRKIFLYPENWIVPELRDDKSAFFKDLENELLQNEITDEAAENALLSYLEKLDEVAKLDVRALYHQREYGEVPIDVLHIFARTQATPHVYYYRTQVDSSSWTPWEKVEVDIQGDHLLAAVWNRRLYVLWPMLREVADNSGTRWEIQLAWSEYKNGHWSAKNITDNILAVPVGSLSTSVVETVTTRPGEPVRSIGASMRRVGVPILPRVGQTTDGDPVYPNIDIDDIEVDNDPEPEVAAPDDDTEVTTTVRLDPRGFVFKSAILDDELVVTCFLYTTTNFKYRQEIGTFRFSGCHGRVAVQLALGTAETYVELVPNYCYAIGMQLSEAATGTEYPLFIRFVGDNTAAVVGDTVLAKTKDAFNLAVSHQYEEFAAQDKFFYQDSSAAYLVTPKSVAIFDQALAGLQNADLVSFSLNYASEIALVNGVNGPTSQARQRRIPAGTMIGHATQTLLPNTTNAQAMGSLKSKMGVSRSSRAFLDVGIFNTADEKTYAFSNVHHPYVCTFIETLNRDGIRGLMQRSLQQTAESSEDDTFASIYEPIEGAVRLPYPEKTIDFSTQGAYSLYNWELFFHAPLLFATRLSQNQRFEEAQRWFHYIFDSTARVDSAGVIGPERYWNFVPFYEENKPQTIDELMLELNEGDAELEAQVTAWRENPFNPHLIARMRPVAYMKTVVMKYLDNLIAWGDSLFRQDTIESINEATQLYVLATNILGSRPQSLPGDVIEDSETYNSLADKLDDFSNALVQVENEIPASRIGLFDPLGEISIPPIGIPRPFPVPLPTTSVLYFCIPKNEELSAYWDTVADRLFKIRNCMNIEGVVRQLALFEPPINPALLVQAAAAGIDISSVLSDLYAPLPHYRFQVMLQKAMEFCADVRSLGAALLSALEKQDAEALALLRASQEKQLLDAVRQVREQQIEEVRNTLEGLEKNKANLDLRKQYYETLIENGTNLHESDQLARLADANRVQKNSQTEEQLATLLYAFPQAVVAFPPKTEAQYGGLHLGQAGQSAARLHGIKAIDHSYQANRASILGGYERREQEWEFQRDTADKELAQLDKQIAAAQIRVAIAEQELTNHNKQIEHAQAVHDFMKNKYTNDQLYSWMVSQVSNIYFQSYQMAHDLAKRAEKAYQHELSLTESAFISYGYWDSLKKGLLSGEKLQYDLRRMEKSYLEQNKREYELTKHVSLALLDPVALLKLQTEGECYFSLPEVMFDFDFPGHYLRRIKSVGLSIPCVTGPYTTVSANLTLLSNRVRRNTTATGDYTYSGLEDSRFQHNVGAIQSIAVSGGQQDSGLFELNFRDERYLPFEGSGAISDWSLALTSAVQTFDWSTITDVVMHVRYTAREGGELLREAALKSLQSELEGIPLRRAFSAMHESSTEWNTFLRLATEGEAVLKLDLSEKRFPYFARSLEPTISKIELVALVKSPSTWTETYVTVEGGGRSNEVTLVSADNLYGGNPSSSVEYNSGASPGAWTVRMDTASLGPPSEWIDDLVIIATYQVTVPV
jgi:peptidoglycan hydrolase-like protein with peptidoglycan-binding domain